MNSDQIRATFLDYFQARGHVVMPSSSLLPLDDPTVLLTPAGVHQMQPFFMGKAKPPAPRLASCQKCFRTTDIDSVGDPSHLTFFEMLGNFSVGDYFKEGAIDFAWQLLTEAVSFDPARLNVTVHPEDMEAPALWRRKLPAERIFQDPDNWWAIKGSAGPCGPDTEIYYDRGGEFGCGRAECRPGCDCDRYLEIWNLVFTEYLQDESNHIQDRLQSPNIDTGAGLERWSLLLQGKPTVYETDLFGPIIQRVEGLSGQRYGQDLKRDRAMRVLADHGRAMTFLIGDGLEPSNEGRGYILRRVMRRAVRFGRLMGLEQTFLPDLAQGVVDRMAAAYPNLSERRSHILQVVGAEEDKFNQTLTQGLNVLNEMLASALRGDRLAGSEAFRLYDTYGFPLEVTEEILAERGMDVDREGFEQELERQRSRSRAAGRSGVTLTAPPDLYRSVRQAHGPTTFLGYDTTAAEATVVAILAGSSRRERLEAGEAGEIVLDQTPFYAMGGGQVGDTGRLEVPGRGVFHVATTDRALADLSVHRGSVTSGVIAVGDVVKATVNEALRWDTARNHTGTHILHAALRRVLGAQATQAGSVVEPDRLRFDFHHSAPLTDEQIREVERIANEEIRRNDPVETRVMAPEQALAEGAIGLFEEKYGDSVRVVSLPGFSKELCGGTHCRASGQIGQLVIVGQESIGSGVRRIEALTGRRAAEYVRDRLETLRAINQVLPVPEADLPKQVQRLLDELSRREKQIERLKREGAGSEADSLVAQIKALDGETRVLAEPVSADGRQDLRNMMDRVKTVRFSGVVTLGAVVDGKPAYVTYVSKDLVGRGVTAGAIVKEASVAAGGSGGGGRPDMAEGGGKDPDKLAAGLAAAAEAARAQIAAG
ncbi:MAG: alanine--tRNA ligase [Chloroflexota bacterium]|nr:alanine--tRNA ligase [Chloroflexota bacterium]